MGGRAPSLLADELDRQRWGARCLCLGYPFHPPRQTRLQLRTEHLSACRSPPLILQGERDHVRSPRGGGSLQPLAAGAACAGSPAGDHSFSPPRSSGLSEA